MKREILELLPDCQDPSSAEIIREGLSLAPGELLRRCRVALDTLEPEEIARVVAYDVHTRLGPSETQLRVLCGLAEKDFQAVSDALKDLALEIEQDLHETQRVSEVGDLAGSLEFLYKLLGESCWKVVARRSGVQPATVRRWSRGGRTDRIVQYEVRALAGLLYALLRATDISLDDLQRWLQEPSRSGRSPLEIWLRDGRISAGAISASQEEALRRWGYVF